MSEMEKPLPPDPPTGSRTLNEEHVPLVIRVPSVHAKSAAELLGEKDGVAVPVRVVDDCELGVPEAGTTESDALVDTLGVVLLLTEDEVDGVCDVLDISDWLGVSDMLGVDELPKLELTLLESKAEEDTDGLADCVSRERVWVIEAVWETDGVAVYDGNKT